MSRSAGQRAQTDVVGKGRVFQLAFMQENLPVAKENPALVKAPTVLVHGEDTGGLSGPAAELSSFATRVVSKDPERQLTATVARVLQSRSWPARIAGGCVRGSSSWDGEYLADVDVHIEDMNGNILVDTVSDGPLFLADLPAGRYKVTAAEEGISQIRVVSIGGRRPAEAVFHWSEYATN